MMTHTNGNGNGYGAISEPQLLFIDGRYQPSKSGAFLVKNPMTGEALYQCASATIEDYDAAIISAYTAHRSWSRLGPSARRLVLLRAADIMESYLDRDASDVLSSEVSATRGWVRANIMSTVGIFRENAALATHIKGEIVPADRPGTTIIVNREAVGVVLAISPWNMPVTLTARAICCPLICGNAVILKPSESSPKSQHLVVRALVEAGLPAGCLQFLPTSPLDAPRAIEFAIRHPMISRVNFTGSDRVGRIIAGIAAQCLKPCLLELGGKAPVLVMDDADIDAAVQAIAFGALNNSGQICMSTERAIVHSSIVREFKERLINHIESLAVGNHLEDPEVQISGLFNPASAKRVLALVQGAVAGGARLLTGDMKLFGPQGSIIRPHVLEGVTKEMDLFNQESFGPVLIVSEFESEADGIEQANATDYTLCASIFSRNCLRAMDIAQQIKTGSCHINGPTVYIEASLPNGGIGGASGYGRFGGIAGIEEFTERQIVSLARPGMNYVF